MDIAAYYRSLDAELQAKKNRVRNFIADAHWLTDGEWKESVLRSVISQHLPDSIKIGRGFVICENDVSTQCDILLYRSDFPVLFRDGDLVFVTADAVIGIIEVKSTLDTNKYQQALDKLAAVSLALGVYRKFCFIGLFSYDWIGTKRVKWDPQAATELLEPLRAVCDHHRKMIDLVCAGPCKFVRWWRTSPEGEVDHLSWHAYWLDSLSAGYFIANVLDAVSGPSVARNNHAWFPKNSKELELIGTTKHRRNPKFGFPPQIR